MIVNKPWGHENVWTLTEKYDIVRLEDDHGRN